MTGVQTCALPIYRDIAPLKMTRDSVKLDTSDMTIDQVIAAMKKIIGEKLGL